MGAVLDAEAQRRLAGLAGAGRIDVRLSDALDWHPEEVSGRAAERMLALRDALEHRIRVRSLRYLRRREAPAGAADES